MERASRLNASVQRGNDESRSLGGVTFLNGDRDKWPTLRTGPDFCRITPYLPPQIRTSRISWNYLLLVFVTPTMLNLQTLVLLLLADDRRWFSRMQTLLLLRIKKLECRLLVTSSSVEVYGNLIKSVAKLYSSVLKTYNCFRHCTRQTYSLRYVKYPSIQAGNYSQLLEHIKLQSLFYLAQVIVDLSQK